MKIKDTDVEHWKYWAERDGTSETERTCQWVDHGCTRCDYSDYSLFEIPERCPGCGAKVIDWW